MPKPALLCVSPSFAPATTPTAIRASALVARLARDWDVTVLTETPQNRTSAAATSVVDTSAAATSGAHTSVPATAGPRIEVVPARRPTRLLSLLRRMRLGKLIELLVWPDESIFWVRPAVRVARRLVRERRPEAVVVFMMPYSAGLVGLALQRRADLALVLNLDDSPTCTDMHPEFPSRLHYRLARGLEDRYARRADATIYVSRTNLELVRERLPVDARERLELVRYGADPARFAAPVASAAPGTSAACQPAWAPHPPLAEPQRTPGERFEIAYVGAMSGWWTLISSDGESANPLKRAYDAWTRLGRHSLIELDPGTSSPAVLGRAMLGVIAEHPDWKGLLELVLYGNPYPDDVVQRALATAGVQDVVRVLGPAPHEQMPGILARADLLFITLPNRLDGSRGGRISAKTYEYLMTDRPILAAVPRGENWDYLEDKPGVWLVAPDDERAMQAVVSELAQTKAEGKPLAFDRSALREELSYDTRAREFASVIHRAIAHHEGRP
ncbi:MAG TPA: glycosyltransferase [Solirubrobacteraceae bacterium]|nr:glycosyltransferase [Solirubrobacteraceae bacterium]